ncbi:hypothetical protein OO013_02265 [Mangrovivirga sp. M17]|uniref:Uncharacterized protein n=1 Tax=Mangrovivirga halotolerans TaxID=2993936 RepID=A0ABT3RLT4_9BACT|nr:hypothetical protein [Mangrovivirga halotolerans]MCX2742669.1 hypothetical protein [Mangrovivirga halotolerans]
MREKQEARASNPSSFNYQIKVATPDNKLLQPKTAKNDPVDKEKEEDKNPDIRPISESDIKAGYGGGMWANPVEKYESAPSKAPKKKETNNSGTKEVPVTKVKSSESKEEDSNEEKEEELTEGTVKASDNKHWTVSQFFEHYNAYDITDKNFTSEELKFFEDYRDDAQKYLDRPNMVWTVKTNLTGESIANAARRTYLKYGRDFSKVLPVSFVLAQAQLETSLGVKTKGNRNNAFNIGEYDGGTQDWVEKITDPEMGTAMYMDLMAEDYLSKRTPEELLKDGGYLNEDDNRYASDKKYEEGLRNQIKFNERYIESVSESGELVIKKRVVGNYSGRAMTNQVEDLMVIQQKLNEIGLLSDEDYNKEGVRKKVSAPEKLGRRALDGTIKMPEETEAAKVSNADTVAISDLTATIKAIETFQQKVMKVGSTVDGWIQIGGGTYNALNNATPELAASQLRTYKSRKARYDSDRYFAREADKAIERDRKNKAESTGQNENIKTTKSDRPKLELDKVIQFDSLDIQSSVGKGGVNKPSDVAKIQTFLVNFDYLNNSNEELEFVCQQIESNSKKIKDESIPQTIAAIKSYQKYGASRKSGEKLWQGDGNVGVGGWTHTSMKSMVEAHNYVFGNQVPYAQEPGIENTINQAKYLASQSDLEKAMGINNYVPENEQKQIQVLSEDQALSQFRYGLNVKPDNDQLEKDYMAYVEEVTGFNDPGLLYKATSAQIKQVKEKFSSVANGVWSDKSWLKAEHLLKGDKTRASKPNYVCCYDAAVKMVKKTGATPLGVNNKIQTFIRESADGKDVDTYTNQALLGMQYIDKQLFQGKAVQVGIEKEYVKSINETVTDHFIVIVGKKYEDGNWYYIYFDPGSYYKDISLNKKNKLLINGAKVTQKIIKNKKEYTYKLSQVRINK